MRSWPLLPLLLACAGCTVALPRAPGIAVSVNATVRAAAVVAPVEPVVAIEGAAVVEFFGIPLEGAQDVVFVLDRSGSMDEPAEGRIAAVGVPDGAVPVRRKIDVAQAELVDALERLPAGTRMNVVFFYSDVEAYAATMVPLEDSGRDGLITFVRETPPTGSTALAPAMRTAFLMNARRIVLLSDGLANVGGDASVVLRDAREAMRGGVRIDTIGLGKDQDAALLQSLADESGGLYQAL